MGLLTDPSNDQSKSMKLLLKYYGKLCVLLYIAGVIWFCSLASPLVNSPTYFSENALLPGLVKSTFKEDRLALQYIHELQDEIKNYEKSIPYPWLMAKFRQIGLDVYTHDFTLKSPLNDNETFYGKNVYGILRAPRASSTESLILSVPYRPPSSVHPTTLPSIAIQLAFAKFAVSKMYWAKDIIFLVTDHEQLGMQAWLEAYHGVTCGDEGILNHGKLRGRAGAIQAAINLELHSVKIAQIDIKIEGLNGQLPNLDLFNLAGRICSKEGMFYTFKGKVPEYHRDQYKEFMYYFKNMINMITTQATGIPTGNHGLFLRFGIQALTLEGFEYHRSGSRSGFLSIGRAMEGIFRSMNNLLEKFHQSFFFYILPSYDRYISIGLYMPSVCMIAAALIIKSAAKWYKTQEEQQQQKKRDINYIRIIVIFVVMHAIGVCLMSLPDQLKSWNFNVTSSISMGLIGVFMISLIVPFLIGNIRKCSQSLNILCIFCLLELGTTLICLSMNNIALGIFCGVISVPLALIIEPNSNSVFRFLQKFFWVLVHPLVVLYIVVIVNTYVHFPKENPQEIVFRALKATNESVIYSIVDSMIYGNWLYSVVCLVLIPNWLCFWCVACSGCSRTVQKPKPKND